MFSDFPLTINNMIANKKKADRYAVSLLANC